MCKWFEKISILRRNDPSPEGAHGLFSSSSARKVPANGHKFSPNPMLEGWKWHASRLTVNL